jgi:hypothetical protein
VSKVLLPGEVALQPLDNPIAEVGAVLQHRRTVSTLIPQPHYAAFESINILHE